MLSRKKELRSLKLGYDDDDDLQTHVQQNPFDLWPYDVDKIEIFGEHSFLNNKITAVFLH